MQAIRTKYIGATNTKPPRITAMCYSGTVTIQANNDLSLVENHKAACQALVTKLDWGYDFVSGTLADGTFVHVIVFLNT